MDELGTSHIIFLPRLRKRDLRPTEEVDGENIEDGSTVICAEDDYLIPDGGEITSQTFMPLVGESTGDGMRQEYEDLPRLFFGWKHWPNSTNLNCWRCGMSFHGPPWFVTLGWKTQVVPVDGRGDPIILYDTDAVSPDVNYRHAEHHVQTPHGVMCHPMCARLYLMQHKDPAITNVLESLRILDRNVNDVYHLPGRRPDMPDGPDPHRMIQFRGKSGMTPQKFREMQEAAWRHFLDQCAEHR
jgi:hypothetical protein